MRPFFGRVGGKYYLRKEIIKHFPPSFTTYVEPFCGAASVFFKKPRKEGETEILNDNDSEVAAVFNLVKHDADFVNACINRDVSKEYFQEIKHSTEPLHILERFKNSYFCKGKSYNYQGVLKIDFIPYGERLKETIIHNLDYKEIIDRYDSKDTFFYLDPPYENSDKSFYQGMQSNPYELFEMLRYIRGKFLLSYNDSPLIREVFKDFHIKEVKTIYSHTQNVSKRRVNELLIANYPIT